MWEFQARCTHVVDGDTYDMVVDLGFRMQRHIRLRHQWLDTHETYGTETESEKHQMGDEETEFAEQWLREAGDEWTGDYPLIVRTEKETGTFGRYLATVERKFDGQMLGDAMTNEFPQRDIYYED